MENNYIEKLIEVEQRSKSNVKRLDEHERKIEELSDFYVALTKVDDKVNNIENDVSEMKTDIKEIKEKPTKRYDQLWGYIVSAIIGALITFLAVKIGLK